MSAGGSRPYGPVPVADVALILRDLARKLQGEGSGYAHIAAGAARVLVPEPDARGGCATCGGPIEPVPRGRPRLHCHACRAPRQKPPKGNGERDG